MCMVRGNCNDSANQYSRGNTEFIADRITHLNLINFAIAAQLNHLPHDIHVYILFIVNR